MSMEEVERFMNNKVYELTHPLFLFLYFLEHLHCQRFSLCGFAEHLGKVTPTALELCYSSLGAMLQHSCKVTPGLLE